MTSETAEITVQYVNYPRDGKKRGSIKSSEGASYWCIPTMLRQFQVGEVCKIEFTTNDAGFHQLNKKIGFDAAAPPKQVMRASTSNTDALHIFVNGKLAAFIAHGDVGLALTDVVQAVDLLVDAYHMSKLSGNKAQRRDDMNDEVPY